MPPGYYEQPIVKPPVWTWEIPAYFFAGGIAGVAAVIAFVAGIDGRYDLLARDARRIALAGAIVSPLLLVSDLGRPSRFLNMLRVFKPRSPMSIGAWALAFFGAAVTVWVMLEEAGLAADNPIAATLAVLAGGLAALAGTVLASYTGVLIGATTVPVWQRHRRLLPFHFTASSLGATVSILELVGHQHAQLNLVGLIAAAMVSAAAARVELDRSGVSAVLTHGGVAWVTRSGDVLSGPLPFLLRLTAAIWPLTRTLAAIAAIAGSLLSRYGWMAAGRRSAADPKWSLE